MDWGSAAEMISNRRQIPNRCIIIITLVSRRPGYTLHYLLHIYELDPLRIH